MFDYRDYHRTVVAFHGTTAAVAERLVDGGAFTPSTKSYEWLGQGAYFWEYAPKQAWKWAERRRGNARPAVVGAMIRLGNCLDLLDPENVAWLKRIQADMLETSRRARTPLRRNYRDKKSLDCAVFNWIYSQSDATATPIQTSRAVYVPTDKAKRVWPGSWIYEESHVQVCVREPKNIFALWHVRTDGRYGRDDAG
ncbi:hypothetical protein [Paludisphaera soli]|uniref:hypothetical protein n=1 Tax=Paludisphaera soli TaxID=2712865 RepID=UPI0013ED6B47|nr:hypothetical protein [Paludisphaera soli]